MSETIPDEQQKIDELVGTVVDGRFAVLSQIGIGASGVVYRAMHRLLGKQVALKVLHQDTAADPRAQERFKREVQALTSLQHPNIVQPLACGTLKNGRAFLVMELVEGKSLDQKIEEGITQRELARIAIACCCGLQHAHEHNIVHRDVSPRNIVLIGAGDDLVAQILDFGISAVVSPDDSGQSQTTTGAKGSPHYMSPEQCQQHPVDARSDIYSLGCVMYHALAGHTPFDAESAFELMYKHAHDPVPSLPAKQNINKKLSEIVVKCLQKDPADRFQSMSELKNQLMAVVASLPQEKPSARMPAIPKVAQPKPAFHLSRASYAIIGGAMITAALLTVASIEGIQGNLALACAQLQPKEKQVETLHQQAKQAMQEGRLVDAKLLIESGLKTAHELHLDHRRTRELSLLNGDVLQCSGAESDAQEQWNQLWHDEANIMMNEVNAAGKLEVDGAVDAAKFLRSWYWRLHLRGRSYRFCDQLYSVGNILANFLAPPQVVRIFYDVLPPTQALPDTQENREKQVSCINQLGYAEMRLAAASGGEQRKWHLQRATQFWTQSIELKSLYPVDYWLSNLHIMRSICYAAMGDQKRCNSDDKVGFAYFDNHPNEDRDSAAKASRHWSTMYGLKPWH